MDEKLLTSLLTRVAALEQQSKRGSSQATMSEIIRTAAARRGLTLTETAGEAGIKLQRLSRALHGRAVLSAVDIAALAETLGLDDGEVAAMVRASSSRMGRR